MKKTHVVIVLFLLSVICFSSELVESYRVNKTLINDAIALNTYEIQVYGRNYSIQEWWKNQPVIRFEYEGVEAYVDDIESVLQRLGCVFGDGELLKVKTEKIQDRFLYIETRYQAKTYNNMDSLMLLSEDNSSKLYDFFLTVMGEKSTRLPKLILIHSEEFFQTSGDILYRGPEYTVIKTFDKQLNLAFDEKNLSFDIPFYPVLFLDCQQNQFQLTLETKRRQLVLIDGKRYHAQTTIHLNEGVHEIEYVNRTQYIYLKEHMVLPLDDVQISELTIRLNVPAQVQILQDGKIVETFESKGEKVALIPGQYLLKAQADGYRAYEESLDLSSSLQRTKDIRLVEVPGTVLYRMNVSKLYTDLFFQEHEIILTNSDESLFIDVEANHISPLPSRVVWFDGAIFVAADGIFSKESEQLFTYDGVTVYAVKTKSSLWLFTSDKKIIAVDMNTWTRQWVRTVNYTAADIVTEKAHIGIMDLYSRVILIDSQLGYREFFDLRIPGVTGMTFLETTDDRIRINLEGYHGYIDYYLKSRSTDLRKGNVSKEQAQFHQSGNKLFQNDKPLIAINGQLIKVVKSENHLAILTNEEMVVCTGY